MNPIHRDPELDEGILELVDYSNWIGIDIEDIDDFFSPIEKNKDTILGKLIIKDKKIKCYVQPFNNEIFQMENFKRYFFGIHIERLVKGKYEGKDVTISYLIPNYTLKEYEKLMNEKRKNYFQKFSYDFIESLRYDFAFMYLMGYEEIKESHINVIIDEFEPSNSDTIDYNFTTSRNHSKIVTNNKISPSIINKWFKYEPYYLENEKFKNFKGKTPDVIFHEYCKNLCKSVENFNMDIVYKEYLSDIDVDINFIKQRISYYQNL